MAHELYFGLTIEFQRQCHADLAPRLFAIIPKKEFKDVLFKKASQTTFGFQVYRDHFQW
jgi:hypothetical protein